jgi:hypothetical protein
MRISAPAGGVARIDLTNSPNLSESPSASISTAPPLFLTHPLISQRVAILQTNGRKPTPWTEPTISIFKRSMGISVALVGFGFVFHAFNFVYTVSQSLGTLSSLDFTAPCKAHR